ncbi:hypothetical protein PsYK624_041240 [Phanerochaete sordida]|uniref:Uncharacterized protein n=1 Tax=Phanerochaete sordida TaxID=48140 RepID=A0A9P3G4B8_9APHY|nr:hypothetical protein PsYK624_041240 [Phanerochaete sordida]
MAFTIAGPNACPIDVPTFLAAVRRPLEELQFWRIEQLWADPQCPNVAHLVVNEYEGAPARYAGCVFWGEFPHFLVDGAYSVKKYWYMTQKAFLGDLPPGSKDILGAGSPMIFPQFKVAHNDE